MSRLRVDLISPPFSGHLHPLLGIGRRLAQDVQVRVISTESAAARTRSSGLDAISLMAGLDDGIRAITEPPVAVRNHPLRLNAQFRQTLALLGRFREELDALYRQDAPDLVIADFTLPVAGYLALERGIPWWTSLPSPCVIETPDGPPAYLGGWSPRTDLVGRVRDASGRLLVRGFKYSVARLHRRTLRTLGLPGPYRADGTEAAYSSECVLALGLAELEFARQWPAAVRFVGPIRYTPAGLGQPPEFVPGRQHVLVSIGTHLRHDKDRVAAATRAAARCLPHIEFHFTDGRPDVPGGAREENFQRLPYINYELVDRYHLVVHHGGSGILNATLAAGLRAIVMPLDYDQFDNAARLRSAGLAIGLRSLRDLPRAIAQALAEDRSNAVRRHYRDLISSRLPEECISALVRQRLNI
jgi:UDP:flavonoid glycosyltransferase YjiC (YdhE family)